MAVTWNRGVTAQQEPLIADRHLYLDKAGNTVVEEGHADSASQLVAAGHPINQADADRLGLVMRDGKLVQDRAVKIEEHQQLVDQLDAELTALYESIAQYKAENSTKDIPNTMEAARVALETRHEHATLALGQFIKSQGGKDPLKGESQATALEPETSEVARAATQQAKAAVAASPSPAELAKSAPTAKADVAPQHPSTEPSEQSGTKKTAAKKSSAKRGK
jgi:hypothetical protein